MNSQPHKLMNSQPHNLTTSQPHNLTTSQSYDIFYKTHPACHSILEKIKVEKHVISRYSQLCAFKISSKFEHAGCI